MAGTLESTACFGEITLRAYRWPGRYRIDLRDVPHTDTPDLGRLRASLDALDAFSQGQFRGGSSSLLGSLYADWEAAHIYVALNLELLERHAQGEWVQFLSPGYCLLELMRPGRQDHRGPKERVQLKGSQQQLRDQFTALRSAVDLLRDCVTADYAESVLGDYRHGGARHALASSLYGLIDALEAQSVAVGRPQPAPCARG